MTMPPESKSSRQHKRAENALSALIELMAALRHPKDGCEWDLQQTHKSIAPYTIEEAYEVAEAIHSGTPEDLKNELGDLLLQVIFQARIAEENGDFDFADIATSITQKMIRRHPHIFQDTEQRSPEEQRQAWEELKAQERAAKQQTATLDDVATTLPPMTRAVKLQKRAARVGFDWSDPQDVLAKVHEELEEVTQELKIDPINHDRLQGEIGDLLFTVINLARKVGIDPDQSLTATNRKFIHRFSFLEKIAMEQGLDINDVDIDTMEKWWQQSKQYDEADNN
jgi:MazG family protein